MVMSWSRTRDKAREDILNPIIQSSQCVQLYHLLLINSVRLITIIQLVCLCHGSEDRVQMDSQQHSARKPL